MVLLIVSVSYYSKQFIRSDDLRFLIILALTKQLGMIKIMINDNKGLSKFIYLDISSLRTAEVNLLNKQRVAVVTNTTLYKATIVKLPSHSILP